MARQRLNLLKRTGHVLLTVGVVAVIGAGFPAAANADPGGGTDRATGDTRSGPWSGPVPAGFSSWAEVMGVQTRLIAAAERINAAGAQAGLAGIEARPESRRLKVYWKGSPPQATQALISSLRRQVPIDVLPARFSSTELIAASRDMARRPGVATSAPNVDGSGVTVTVTAAAARSLAVPNAIGVIPVTVKTGDQPAAAACTGRQDDCSA